jgi:hypothetical protein
VETYEDNTLYLQAITMDINDDAPPELVEAGQEMKEDEKEEKHVKVPITIVTGKSRNERRHIYPV